MPLVPGVRIGIYEVTGPLGEGGMGEVYRARDTRLNRDVAIKVLPDAFAADADRLNRLRREAQALAALNHPNIAHVYGLEEAGSAPALVMELVGGATLDELIKASRGDGRRSAGLPLDDVVKIARQIADALEAAHEAGIVHRDLKPANIKVRDDGVVKVLDFGLAKGSEGTGVSRSGAEMATVTSPAMTQMGMILGTAAYMAPEQAKGRPVDKRADIWSFGVVLHEMITGRRLFEADDVSETLAAVLTRDVSTASLSPDIPARLRALIASCLVRDPRARLRDIGDARIALDAIIAGGPDVPVAPEPAAATSRRFVWPAVAIASLVAAIALGIAWATHTEPAAELEEVRFVLTPPPHVQMLDAAPRISPDGKKIAFVASDVAGVRTWIHDLASGVAASLTSTASIKPGPTVWSPDSRALVFFAGDSLRKVQIDGGPAQVLTAVSGILSRGATWAGDVILVGGGPIHQLSATGGTLQPVTTLDEAKGEFGHRAPNFLPDGRHFTFVAVDRGNQNAAAYVGTLGSTERRPLPGIQSEAKYVRTGHLLFVREDTLMAQAFDLERLELRGPAVPVVERLATAASIALPYSVSDNGTVVYRPASSRIATLEWFDRSGKSLGAVAARGDYADIELSLDDRYVAYESGAPGDIWVLDLVSGIAERVTTDAAREADPVWSPDGKRIAFRADGAGGRLHVRPFGAGGKEEPLHHGAERASPGSWSRDGKYVLFHTNNGLFALPTSGDRTPMTLVEGVASIDEVQMSPDGRWIAYESMELGQRDVFVQSFPAATVKRRVSIAGGRTARWHQSSREIFYLAPDSTLMAVTITGAGDQFSTGAPIALFKPNISTRGESSYAVASDGRFLIAVPNDESGERPIWVHLNWRPPGR